MYLAVGVGPEPRDGIVENRRRPCRIEGRRLNLVRKISLEVFVRAGIDEAIEALHGLAQDIARHRPQLEGVVVELPGQFLQRLAAEEIAACAIDIRMPVPYFLRWTASWSKIAQIGPPPNNLPGTPVGCNAWAKYPSSLSSAHPRSAGRSPLPICNPSSPSQTSRCRVGRRSRSPEYWAPRIVVVHAQASLVNSVAGARGFHCPGAEAAPIFMAAI